MTRLEVLKDEKEQIKGLRCLSFGLIDKCIEWYDKEIEAIVIHGADNKFYGQQADDPYQTDMDEAWEQAKSELMQIYMSLSEEKKQAIDVLMAQNCDQCEVGNPCLYCEHEFKAKADRNEFYNWDAPIRHKADGEYISKGKMLMFLNDMRFGIAPDETVADDDERREREAQVDVLDDLMEVVEQMPIVAIPSAEPKTGHCEDCKHFRKLPYHADTLGKCIHHWGFCPKGDWYCADFEPQERSE